MAELVTLEDAKAHLKLSGSTEDPDLELKLAQAHALVLDYVGQRVSDEAAWQATVAAWTDETVPAQVQAAILKQFGALYRFRGDDTDAPADQFGLAPGVANLLGRFRDPALA